MVGFRRYIGFVCLVRGADDTPEKETCVLEVSETEILSPEKRKVTQRACVKKCYGTSRGLGIHSNLVTKNKVNTIATAIAVAILNAHREWILP